MSVRRTCAAIVAIALCATACDAEPASDAGEAAEAADVVAPATGERALRAEYDQMWGELGRVHLVITTTGPDQVRVLMTTPDDEPVSEWLWVYDGERLLEHSNDPEGYTVYPDPEKAEFFELVRLLVLPPGSGLLETACPEADRLGSEEISGRMAFGYACGKDAETFAGAREIWVDEATGLVLAARRLKLVHLDDVPVDDSLFSTEPPERAASEPSLGDPQEPSGNPTLARLRKLAATTQYPVYFLGEEFDGGLLVDVGVSNNRSGAEVVDTDRVEHGQTLFLIYGEDIDLTTEPFSAARYRHAVGCRRLEPLRGVPTVEQADGVWLFTGDVVVRLGGLAVGYHPELVAPAGTALRLVGQDEPTGADLPPPRPENVAAIDAACGATPGDHGPVGDQ